jgi:hypothetical protein
MNHQRTSVRYQAGRQVAELGAVGDEVQRLGMLALALSDLLVAMVKGLIALARSVLASFQTALVHLVVVALALGAGLAPTAMSNPAAVAPKAPIISRRPISSSPVLLIL